MIKDNDGVITRDEMEAIVGSVFSLIRNSDNFTDELRHTPKQRVERIFAVMDTVIIVTIPMKLFYSSVSS